MPTDTPMIETNGPNPYSTIRCKFYCTKKTISGTETEKTNTFDFAPVAGTSEENKRFWKWTPSGALSFQYINPEIDFQVGKEYYLDLKMV
jgi:hypothetical protein